MPRLVDIDPATYNLVAGGRPRRAVAADEGDHSGASLRPLRRHGSAPGDRRPRRACRSSRTPARPSARPTRAGRPDRWGRPAASRSFPSKNLGAFGDGGLVTTERCGAGARDQARSGITARRRAYYHQQIGGNFRLDALQAAVLRVKLPHLARVDRDAARERGALPRSLRRRCLPDAPIVLPVEPDGRFHIYNQFVVRVPDRDRVARVPRPSSGIGTEVYYPVPFHLQECFAYARPPARRFPSRRGRRGVDARAAHLWRADRRATGDRRASARRRAHRECGRRHGMTRVMVTGAAGQLGSTVVAQIVRDAATSSPFTRAQLDIADAAAVLDDDDRGVARTSSSTARPTTTSMARRMPRRRR